MFRTQRLAFQIFIKSNGLWFFWCFVAWMLGRKIRWLSASRKKICSPTLIIHWETRTWCSRPFILLVFIITVVGVMVWHQELMNGGEDSSRKNNVKDEWQNMSN
jgi:hypothetical protein